MTTLRIDCAFDGGSIDVVSANAKEAVLRIAPDAPDHGAPYSQWFYFRAVNVPASGATFKIVNAGETTYPGGWENYNVCYSVDRKTWKRCKSSFADGILEWKWAASHHSGGVYFSYFPPYSHERHLDFCASCGVLGEGRCALDALPGSTIDGRLIDMLRIGAQNPPPLLSEAPALPSDRSKLVFWVLGRQHPGETQVSTS